MPSLTVTQAGAETQFRSGANPLRRTDPVQFPAAGRDLIGQVLSPVRAFTHRRFQPVALVDPVADLRAACVTAMLWPQLVSGLVSVGGYNVLDWTDDGVAYWAISDMAAADLDKFARLFRAASPDQ